MCSRTCWSSALRQRIERELFFWKVSPGVRHSHRVPLGLLLLSLGWITADQLQAALEAQRKARQGRIGDWIRRKTALTEKEITRALAMQWNCPVFSLEAYRPQPAEVPRELLECYRILPLPARGRNLLYLAFESGMDAVASYAVQHITGRRVESGLVGEEAFKNAWASALAIESSAASTAPVETSEGLCAAAAAILEQPGIVDARLARLHQHVWLRAFSAQEEGLTKHRDHLYVLPARAPAALGRSQ